MKYSIFKGKYGSVTLRAQSKNILIMFVTSGMPDASIGTVVVIMVVARFVGLKFIENYSNGIQICL